MGVGTGHKQVTWDTGNNTDSVSAGGNVTSDAITPEIDTGAQQITCEANNGGTPASGDTVSFYLLQSSGDTDQTGGDSYDTTDNKHFLCKLNTHSGTGGNNPSQKTVPMPGPQKAFKVYVESAAASNSITVAARTSALELDT